VQPELAELKSWLSRKYLGKGNIHGVSVRSSPDMLVVFVSPGSNEQNRDLLQQLEADAAPVPVRFIEEEPPTAAS
jgi:hypothetical protein